MTNSMLPHASSPGVTDVELPGLAPWRRGKVRSVYEAGPGHLVIVATDRLSAYDCVLPTPIPGKGEILTRLTTFWMRGLASASPHHLVSDDPREFPEPFRSHAALLEGRSHLVRRAERIDIECVVRGHLTGSGWKEYRRDGRVCGVALPPGLHDGARLEPAIFTPATKEEHGHDVNISFERMAAITGPAIADELRRRSIDVYRRAADHARSRGIIIADTKLEWGWLPDGSVILVDEVLTPDSSRFWPLDQYKVGGNPPSFDKQFVRDWLESSGWDKNSPPPPLPEDVVARTRQKYIEAYERLTDREFV